MSSGWVCLHKSLLKWEWWEDHNATRLFVYLLLKANYEPTKWKGIDLDRGQAVIGRKALAKETGLSERQIRTALTKLKTTSTIAIKTTSKFSIVTICNYDLYQDKPNKNDQQSDQQQVQRETSKRPANDQQTTTSKQINNLNKETKKQETTIQRCSYGECLNVLLSDDEHIKLTQKYGANALNVAIDVMDAWIASKPNGLTWFQKKYSSAFSVMNSKSSWVWQRVAESTISRPNPNLNKAEIKSLKTREMLARAAQPQQQQRQGALEWTDKK